MLNKLHGKRILHAMKSLFRTQQWQNWGHPTSEPAQVAICLHCFYLDVALHIIDQLKAINTPYTLFITCPRQLLPVLKEKLKGFDRQIYILAVDNIGRDVKPFFECLRHPEMTRFEHILKLHTKRGKTQYGDIWRDVFLGTIVGNSENFKNILDTLQNDPNIMCAGPKHLYISAGYFMYGNQPAIKNITSSLLEGFLPVDWGFFGGTMFWARRTLFDQLLEHETKGIRFGAERGATDGEIEHAFERIFGLLPLYKNGKTMLLEKTIETGKNKSVITIAGNPSKKVPTQTLRDLKDGMY